MSTSELSGSWAYRSFNPTFAGTLTREEDALVLAEALVTLRSSAQAGNLEGEYEWRDGGLNLTGTFEWALKFSTTRGSKSWAGGARTPVLTAGNTVTMGICCGNGRRDRTFKLRS